MAVESYVLKVAEVIEETNDAKSVAFEVPDDLQERFAYTPGQFLTVAVPSDQTGLAARCYSLSSSPHSGRHQITVKRTADGYASNWICDNLKAGDTMRLLPPSGIFTPKDINADLLLWGGGSGITPVISIARTALEKGSGKVVLFYANRDETSVIFAAELRELVAEHPDRFTVVHWLESVQGLPTQEGLKQFATYFADYTSFCCGPAPFMKAVATALKELEIPRDRRHQEKFVSLGGNPFGDVEEVLAAQKILAEADDGEEAGEAAFAGPVSIEVELDGNHYAFDDWDGKQVLLEFLESKGVDAPFSCREGNCSSCACIVLDGDISMKHNDVLDAEDLADGIRLTCQALPLTETLKISYNG
ncbi:ferredoxin--NADP reductase [Nocardioides marmoriginsengisoli]|uniref:Ferredoxin--NADP reductase n=1 Tax=Nocardioides marmoriginsengisoli TaxID=661483 RepID=A0A3N0C9I5_9ACTN|nr:ferredoxin--NADP reductase [Nocardioides marmoriginsengisoli]RNL59959.1 ferredoxin--NADP reductase [Nocardioides marmoriginsengisoli]